MPRLKTFSSVAGRKYDGMMGRCYREKDISYKNYGAKGIRVCSAWIENIESFKLWLLNELSANKISLEDFVKGSNIYQLDRIDVKGSYEPTNCRIVNPQTNSRNRNATNKRKIVSSEGNEHYFK